LELIVTVASGFSFWISRITINGAASEVNAVGSVHVPNKSSISGSDLPSMHVVESQHLAERNREMVFEFMGLVVRLAKDRCEVWNPLQWLFRASIGHFHRRQLSRLKVNDKQCIPAAIPALCFHQ
jgi:hypothetical protein